MEAIEQIAIELVDLESFESHSEVQSLDEVGIIVPASFSPNGEGEDDVFKIAYGRVFNFKLVVFDENGKSVYKTTNPGFQWNGFSDGKKLAPGIYKWIISGQDIKSRSFDFLGSVEIK